MPVDIVALCPNLVALLGEDDLRAMSERDQRWKHPLAIICERDDEARDQFLTGLDAAIGLMEPIIRRSPSRMRAKVAGGLRSRGSFDATVAEVLCGARLEKLGAMPVMENVTGNGRQPDYRCFLLDQVFFVEVYAPNAGPRDSLLDDVAHRLKSAGLDGSVMLDLSKLPRDSKHAKVIADGIKRVIARLRMANIEEAIAFVPFGKTLAGWTTKLGETELTWSEGEDPEFFARFRIDGTRGLFLGGVVDGEVVDARRDARNELRELGQLQKGQANVLVVDITSKEVNGYMIDSYKEIVTNVFENHPELSAILLTWRTFGLRPSPSRHHEVRSGYIPIPSKNPQATQLSSELLARLATPGLITQRPA